MFEIDKAAFGEFVAGQRKEKGYTQKELAEKLYVSDKAVSKWERGISMPDISLLIPLAEVLEVSVTELLEGRLLEHTDSLDSAQVEVLVKKALTLSSEERPEQQRAARKKNAAIFVGCAIFALVESAIGIWLLLRADILAIWSGMLVMEGLSLLFGIYFWFFMRTRLPAYYDENKISAYSDGVFRMNVPGLCFNNSNWPYMVKSLRLWSVVSMLALPLLICLLAALAPDFWPSFIIQQSMLILYLASLFVPVYVLGKKYG